MWVGFILNLAVKLAEGVGFEIRLNLYLILRISDSTTPLFTPSYLKTYLIYLRSAGSYILRHLTLG